MPAYFAHYSVLFSCPSDMACEKETIESALEYINCNIAKMNNIQFDVKYWRNDVLFSHGSPQEIINNNIVYSSDLIIAVFGTKLGSKTDHYESGTIEEIEKMIDMGKQVFVCFSEKDIIVPANASEEFFREIEKVRNFKKSYKGLYITFKTDEELKEKIQNQISLYCSRLISSEVVEKFSCGIPFTLQENRNTIKSVANAKKIIFCARTGKIFLLAHYNHLRKFVENGGHLTFLTSENFNVSGDCSEFQKNQQLSMNFITSLQSISPKNVIFMISPVPVNNTILYVWSEKEEFIDFKFNFQSNDVKGRPMFRVYKGNPFFNIFFNEVQGLISLSSPIK